ncbi:MAG: acyl-ACP--UDP-N-acetylglucosamine O-acyltransferase [Alphaproteobacteria bacterium]|nr:acyl-ACP--UDP-N-acetylglucosamine O-acyltransferase [Alphaproteobacteria bacterium]
MSIHPTAIVEDGAILGAGAEIGPFSLVRAGAKLGDGVKLHSHVVIEGRTEIGANTIVYPQAVLGGAGQIRGGDATGTKLIIGANCEIREAVTISAGSKKGGGVTRVGDNCYFMAYSHAGHDAQIGNNVTIANGAQIAGHAEIGDGVIFGGLAAVQQFARVGKFAFISGLSGVSTDVIPYAIAIGLHVRIGGLNIIGLRRRKVPHANIHAMRAAFRYIFLEGRRAKDAALDAAAQWADVPEVRDITDFILAKPNRPICPARTHADGDGED